MSGLTEGERTAIEKYLEKKKGIRFFEKDGCSYISMDRSYYLKTLREQLNFHLREAEYLAHRIEELAEVERQ